MNNWYYGSKWGLTDLYPDVEEVVRNLVESCQSFERVGIDSAKSIEGWDISCDGAQYIISVWAEMDDMPDIIFDAPHGEDLTDEEVSFVENTLYMTEEFATTAYDAIRLPVSATLEDIYKAVDESGSLLQESLDKNFKMVCSLVDYVLNERRKE